MLSFIPRALLATALTTACLGTAAAQTLTFGSNPQGSVGYAISAAIGSAAGDRGMRSRVVPQGGPEVILPGLNRGSFDLTVTPSIPTLLGHQGKAMFNGKPLEELRVVAVLFPLTVGFTVKNDSDIHSISDLRGKRVASSFPRQRPLLMMSRATLATVGMTLEDIEEVSVPDGTRGLDELASGGIDAAIYSVNAGRVAQTHASVRGGIRFIPVENSGEAEKIMQGITPSSYIETVQPNSATPWIVEPTPMLSSSMLLVTNSQVSDETVRALLETLVEDADDIAATHGAFRAFNVDGMYRDFGAPYHPAALAFFRERGLID
ncbi:MAG: TAXI family TRAP transporter solute-binding subunit [Aquisalimonadaceae bacterium]